MRGSSKASSAGSFIALGVIGAAALLAKRKLSNRPTRKFRLNGKGVLITGGSRGLGLALANELGLQGAKVALCARDKEELENACELLRAKGVEAHPIPADLTKDSDVTRAIERAIELLGSIDVLVNDAGRIAVGPFSSFTRQDFEDAMDLMFWAPVNLTYAVLPYMRTRGSGQIINVTSVGGRVSIPHLLPYSCAKFAFVGFSTGLSTELSAEGIHVLTVIPGLMRTGSYLQAEFKGASRDEFAWFGLLGNLPGFSVAAETAARHMREALEAQQKICTISLPAKLLIALEAMAPEISRELARLTSEYLLPRSKSSAKQSGKSLNPSLNAAFKSLTALGRLAATRLNE